MMRKFVEKSKNLVAVVSVLLILGSVLVSVRKISSPSTFEEDIVFLDVYGREIPVPEEESSAPRFFDLNILFLVIIITLLFVGGWLLVRKLKGKRRPLGENEKARIKKDDLKRIQEALELYCRLRQFYPKAGDEFERIIKNLKPPLEGSLREYHYENPESDTQRYRLWCVLEDKGDPTAKDGVYELFS